MTTVTTMSTWYVPTTQQQTVQTVRFVSHHRSDTMLLAISCLS